MPTGRDVVVAPPSFRQHFLAEQQSELHADAGKPDALASRLGGGSDIVIFDEVPAVHARSIIQDRQQSVFGTRGEIDLRGAGIQRIGDDFSKDCFFQRTRVGITEVFKQMEEIDAGFAHGSSCRTRRLPKNNCPSANSLGSAHMGLFAARGS